MVLNTATKINVLFEFKNLDLTILSDQYANLFWNSGSSEIKPLSDLPWELQAPFFLTFLHDDSLAERFKNLEIIGAIDIYLKSYYYLGKRPRLYC